MDQGPGAVGDEAEYIRLLERATVAIHGVARGSDDGSVQGTGFFVAPRLVATCAHVVAPAASPLPDRLVGRISTTAADLRLIPARERYFRGPDGLDLAFLEVVGTDPGSEQPFVLMSEVLAVGDELFAYGHPEGAFRAGQSALFTHQGHSRRTDADPVDLPRGFGTPIRGGYSGSGVINLRTGAVCGMVCTSDHAGSTHLIPVAAILARCEEAKALHDAAALMHRNWLLALTDEQIRAGGWRCPGPRLREYLHYAGLAAEQHPYRDAVGPVRANGSGGLRTLPPLSSVYVYPLAVRTPADGSDDDRLPLPAEEIFEQDVDALLIGEAGAGKSSLLRAAANASVRRWLRDDADRFVPVRIRATDLVGPATVPEAIAAGVNASLSGVGARRTWTPSFFADAPIPDVTWLVLVDGLDEVMDIRQRQVVIDKLAGFRAQARDSHRMVLTTRPLSDLGTQLPPHWELAAFRLSLFTDDQLIEFVELWLGYLGVLDVGPAARDLTRRLAASALADLARNPMLAMMLCQLYAGDPAAPLPTSSVELYQRFVSLLVDRMYRTDGAVRRQINEITYPYGLRAEAAGDELLDRLTGDIRRLAHARRRDPALSVVRTVVGWTDQLRPGQVPRESWTDLLRAMLRGSGVLVEHEREFDFIHHTVAEYLAAQFVSDDPRLAKRAFREIFPRTVFGNWAAAQDVWRHPYARFLVSGWQHRRGLTAGLLRALRRVDLDACRFVATLAREGVPVDPKVSRAALAIAVSPGRGRSAARRQLAIGVAVALDQATGLDLLYALARDRTAEFTSRCWAIETLGELADPHAKVVNLLKQGTGFAGLRWALYAIATRFGAPAAELLADLAGDATLRVVDRRRAAEALGVQDPARRAVLLAELSAAVDPAGSRPRGTPTARRVRSRLARLNAPWQVPAGGSLIEPLMSAHRRSHPKGDHALLRKAFDTADELHVGQYRRSGDPFITHPLSVATILAELGMDSATLAAGLLHDTTVDCDYSLAALRSEFGDEVAGLVEGVTTIDGYRVGDRTGTEVMRDLVRISRDPRVLIIKLADRLHNLRTLLFLARETQERVARETLRIVVPLAHRLGIEAIRGELEDLSFRTLYPKRYEEIEKLITEQAPRREAARDRITRRVRADLKAARIKADLEPDPVRPHSIEPGPPSPSVGVCVLVDSAWDCYAALGVIHTNWHAVPSRFRDYIAMPRTNLYRALHTTVIGPTGEPVKLRILTGAMYRTARYGIAAHWRYRDGKGDVPADPAEFMDGLLLDLSEHAPPADPGADRRRLGSLVVGAELRRVGRTLADHAPLERLASIHGYADSDELLAAVGARSFEPADVVAGLIAEVDSLHQR